MTTEHEFDYMYYCEKCGAAMSDVVDRDLQCAADTSNVVSISTKARTQCLRPVFNLLDSIVAEHTVK